MNKKYIVCVLSIVYIPFTFCSETPNNLKKALTCINNAYKNNEKYQAQYVKIGKSLTLLKDPTVQIDHTKTRSLDDARMLYAVTLQDAKDKSIKALVCTLSNKKKDGSLYLPSKLQQYIEEMIKVRSLLKLQSVASPSGTYYRSSSVVDAQTRYVPFGVASGHVYSLGLSCDAQGYPYFNGKKILCEDNIDLSWSLRIEFNAIDYEMRVRHLDYEKAGELYEKIMKLSRDEKAGTYMLTEWSMEALNNDKMKALGGDKTDTATEINDRVECFSQ